jgi:hypothetical protein
LLSKKKKVLKIKTKRIRKSFDFKINKKNGKYDFTQSEYPRQCLPRLVTQQTQF